MLNGLPSGSCNYPLLTKFGTGESTPAEILNPNRLLASDGIAMVSFMPSVVYESPNVNRNLVSFQASLAEVDAMVSCEINAKDFKNRRDNMSTSIMSHSTKG